MAKTLIGNIKGKDGRGISKIEKTATTGTIDTYTITYTDGTQSTYELRNPDDIAIQRQIVPSAAIESSTTASQAYSAGNHVVVNGVLRKVTASIAKGSTISDSNSTATTVTGELATIGDSVSQATKFERLYDDGGWHIWHMGKLVMVNASGVVIAGSGSWDFTTCLYTIPDGLRPAQNIGTGGMSRDGALSTLLYVNTDGSISINNAGGAGKANVSRYASLTYMAG